MKEKDVFKDIFKSRDSFSGNLRGEICFFKGKGVKG